MPNLGLQVTDCLAEAKRAGADVLQNPLRTPAHKPSRAPQERRGDDAPPLTALASGDAAQESGRAARVRAAAALG